MNAGCPHCQTWINVDGSQAGSVVNCPRCGNKFQVPVPSAYVDSPQSRGHQQPAHIQEYAGKKLAAGICGILVGAFGVHKFILGFHGAGAMMLTIWIVGIITGSCLIVPIFASMAIQIIGLVEGILYLTKTDEEFYRIYAVERREWF